MYCMYESAVKFSKICKSFGGKVIFSGFDMCVEKGDFISILGPNGCGKTTLMNLLCDFVDLDGGDIVKSSKNMSVVGQDTDDFLFPWKNIIDNAI